ncbi:glycosyltransferase [Cohnella thailandensis]|uniref:Glycosyltransferase n=1 Tax=Cohnella thailandensis TaxID=557557 RepID=A0A841T033_9BACL|nr:glycosyltransferase [Cohnella thailandensis]MBB6635875.1 glycosyltransferase [Cohnella thailandensis]MBP1976253.1 glycosyltransferase involved in cell wall biosynthesis [Cohnella thailandensis]
MALNKPRAASQRTSIRQIAYLQGQQDGFKKGHQDGFLRGKEDGARRGGEAARHEPQGQPLPSYAEILVISASIIPSLEIGVIQPLEALSKLENLRYDVRLEHEVTEEMIAASRTVLFVRNVEPAAYALLEKALQLGKRTVYVIDDNFLELNPAEPIGQYYSDPARRETFIRFLRDAHMVKVDAPDLGNVIREKYNSNVVYFPASVDFEWLDRNPKPEKLSGPIVIGYEGSPKEEDFVPVVPALKKILYYYGGFVRLEFMGFVPSALADHPCVIYEDGGMDYKSFIGKLNQRQWDIGLAPLDDNPFNRGKTNNKYREYAACGIPGIYSSLPIYTSWIDHEQTGYLVKHTEDGWYEGIKRLIEDVPLRLRIQEQAYQAARQSFSLEACVDNWKNRVLN